MLSEPVTPTPSLTPSCSSSAPRSGRSKSSGDGFEFGFVSVPGPSGGREPQCPHLLLPVFDRCLLAAVLDGHGEWGISIAARARELLRERAHSLGDFSPLDVDSLYSAFERVQATLEQEAHAEWSGTTVTLAVVDATSGTATVAHVGDSGLVVAHPDGIAFATAKHTVDVQDELRIEALGGEVRTLEHQGVSARCICEPGQTGFGLPMVRSLGDVAAHRVGACATPAVSVVPMQPHSCCVLASSAVWRHMCPEEVAELAKAGSGDAWTAARLVAAEAQERMLGKEAGADDVTVVVVRPPASPPLQQSPMAASAPTDSTASSHHVASGLGRWR